MARYIDAMVIPVPKKNVKAYVALVKKTSRAWMKYGALEYLESVADDVPKGKITSFPRSVKLKGSETVIFAYVVYRSRAHRDQVMGKMMGDEKVMKLWESLPLDGMRMIFGGFKSVVSTKK
jgi:uncharacterized protein YbaA (DUF1428 family)